MTLFIKLERLDTDGGEVRTTGGVPDEGNGIARGEFNDGHIRAGNSSPFSVDSPRTELDG